MLMPRAQKIASAIMDTSNKYLSNGVFISPTVPTAGERLKVEYDGLLAKSGASHVYARIGFGNTWDSLYDYPMHRTASGFEATVPVARSETMNICFKDNQHLNY
jgi:hypothetical protein